MSKYDLNKVHQEKAYNARRVGKTVDAVMEAIGKIMVTENESIAFVITKMSGEDNIIRTFRDVCIEHFKETPVIEKRGELGIKGYTSKIYIITEDAYSKKMLAYRTNMTPIIDTWND